MHVLVLNPNTRQDLTDELVGLITPMLAPTGMPVLGATAPFGADYIASEQSYVVAAHAVLEAWHRHVSAHGQPAAVLVACFGDPGVWALREQAGVPVMGLAEAAMREASALGPFVIVTGGHAWEAMLGRLARGLQLHAPTHPQGLLATHTIEASGGALRSDPEGGAFLLGDACDAVCHAWPDAQAIVLGGAALGGWAEKLLPQPSKPVIDSVAAGARWLRSIVSPAC